MSDILTIDTGVEYKQKEELILPLKLAGIKNAILNSNIPEYDITILPNPNMSKLIKQLKMTMKRNRHDGILTK